MTAHPTPEEKKHMLDLVMEVREISLNAGMISRSNQDIRDKASNRLREIVKEMQTFRRQYPFD